MLNDDYASGIMQNEIVSKLRERYRGIPQAFFIRSLEKARSLGDLFDMLDTFPTSFPVEWDEQERRWVTNANLFPSRLVGE